MEAIFFSHRIERFTAVTSSSATPDRIISISGDFARVVAPMLTAGGGDTAENRNGERQFKKNRKTADTG